MNAVIKNETPVAILLAAYNAEKYLSEQIDSVLRQSMQNFTLYIRNDGSSDGTQEIIESYINRYPNKIIQIDKYGGNLGCRDNFFRLLSVVQSKYYMFCDADDVWFDDKVKILYEDIKDVERRHPTRTPILCFADTTVCDSDLNIIAPSYWNVMKLNPEKMLSFNYMAICCTAGGSSSVFNQYVKDLVIPLEDNNLMYDYWIALNVSKHGILHPIRKPVKFYRQHDCNVCGVNVTKPINKINTLSKINFQLRIYKDEIRQLQKIHYGSSIKYFFYKLLILFNRLTYRE